MQLIKDNSNFFVKSLSCIKAVIISALVIFISCEDKNNILIMLYKLSLFTNFKEVITLNIQNLCDLTNDNKPEDAEPEISNPAPLVPDVPDVPPL